MPLQVLGANGELEIPGARRRALLVRLLVSANHMTSTDRLAEDLWEGDPPPGAASTLQSHISFLRKALGRDRIHRSGGGYVLEVGTSELDAHVAESESMRGQSALADGHLNEATELLRSSLHRWRGPALADVDMTAWALPEVTRLAELRIGTFEALHEVLLAQGRHQDVAVSADALVIEYPLRERLWGQLMLSLYRSGRQADALSSFQRLRAQLGEHGIEPTRELVELDEAIVLQNRELDWIPRVGNLKEPASPVDVGRPPSAVTSVPLPDRLSATSQVFVGRETERGLLEDALKETVGDRRPRIVLVGGEPGIGKTSLAALATRAAHEAGATALYGRCDEDLGIPYQPWREALAHLIDNAPQRLEQTIAERSAVLATIGLGRDVRVEAAPGPDMELYALFSAILDVLAAAAVPNGLVLVLDDIHGADVQSLQLVRRLASGSPSMPVLLVATFREAEVTSGSSLAALLADLHREPGVSTLNSAVSVTSSLASDAVGSHRGHTRNAAGVALRDALLAETDGNPFFVGERLRHLAETGSVYLDEGGHWVSGPGLWHPRDFQAACER